MCGFDSMNSPILTPTKRNIESFQKKILNHYSLCGRELPWRSTSDPYKILVSEFMLQQTQVNRVVKYYHDFLAKFPTIFHLARGKRKSVLALWSGLGYNSRAIRLHESAKTIVRDFSGKVPADYSILVNLPGIGDYIASAILSFAFNEPVPVIDINIRRVFTHEFSLTPQIDLKSLKSFVGLFIPSNRSCEWHNALMDYGAAMEVEIKRRIPPLTKQSTFKGSDRELRGKIVKLLVSQKTLAIEALETKFDKEKLHRVISKMLEEKLIKEKKGILRI